MSKSKRRKKGAQDLIKSVLSQSPAQASPALPATPENAADAESLARDFIELYFTLADPVERDVLFDKLVAVRVPVVDDFFASMMEHDDDEYLRAAAAAELARRGDPAALAKLRLQLHQPEELFFFTLALETLGQLEGPPFYDTVLGIWEDETRDAAERHEAMVHLEFLDSARAMEDYVTLIDKVSDVRTMADAEIEAAMAAFARQQYLPALPSLKNLRQRVLDAPWEDPAEGRETADFINEGIELLTDD